jgi:LPXTG-motif cell wall-anchored protein
MNPEINTNVPTTTTNVPTITTNLPTNQNSTGFINNLLKKFTENKNYKYIAIGIIILALAALYYYKKCKKESKTNQNKNQMPVKQNNESALTGLNNNDHFILDSNGNPVKVTGTFPNQPLPLPIPKQQPSQQDIQMLQKQMYEKQMQQQMMQQQMMQQQMMQQQMMQQQNSVGPRPKLQHPDNDMSDHIDMELERIQENENENVAQHNLTNSELAEINNKIEAMNSQK